MSQPEWDKLMLCPEQMYIGQGINRCQVHRIVSQAVFIFPRDFLKILNHTVNSLPPQFSVNLKMEYR